MDSPSPIASKVGVFGAALLDSPWVGAIQHGHGGSGRGVMARYAPEEVAGGCGEAAAQSAQADHSIRACRSPG